MVSKILLLGLLGLFLLPYSFSALTDNLIVYYSFDSNTSTTITNLANNSNHGTLTGGAILNSTHKVIGSSLSCNGTNQWLSIAEDYNNLDFNAEFSINFWLYHKAYNGWIFSRDATSTYGSYLFGDGNSNNYEFYTSESGSSWDINWQNKGTLVNNTWQMITIVKNATSYIYYENAIIVYSQTQDSVPKDVSGVGSLCRGQSSGYANILLDEFSIWKGRAITQAEITQLNNSGAGYNPYTSIIVYDYNLTNIFDNSTNHFVKFNTSVALKFTGYNATSLTPQNLTVNITNLGISQNFTSNVASNITFNNASVYNYTVLVYDPFNTSVNYTAYFITSAYNLTSLTYNSSVVNNSYTNYSVNVTELHDVEQNMNVSLTLNGTTYYLDSDELFYNNKYWSSSSTFTTIPLWVNMSLTYGGETLQYYLNYNQNIVSVNVDDCSVYAHQLMNITVRDEQDRDTILVNTTLFTVFNVSGALFPITVTKDANGIIGICLNESVNFTANVDFSFTREGWGATDKINREHFYFNQHFNNSVTQQSFYKLENDTASKIIFNVYDSANLPLGNYYIELRRWYGDTYETVAMAKTGENGQAITYVEYNNYAYYSAVIRDSTGDVVYTTDRQIFTSTPTTIVVLDEVYQTHYDLFNGFSYTENFNTSTNYFTTSITHIEGSDVLFDLDVYYLNGTTICNTYSTTSSISFNCLLNDWINETYIVTAKAYIDDQTVNIYNVIIDERIFDIILNDEDGLLIGFFISLLMCVLLLSINKNYAIMGLPLGLTVSNMLLLTNINIGVIIGLFVSCVAIIFGFLRGER